MDQRALASAMSVLKINKRAAHLGHPCVLQFRPHHKRDLPRSSRTMPTRAVLKLCCVVMGQSDVVEASQNTYKGVGTGSFWFWKG